MGPEVAGGDGGDGEREEKEEWEGPCDKHAACWQEWMVRGVGARTGGEIGGVEDEEDRVSLRLGWFVIQA